MKSKDNVDSINKQFIVEHREVEIHYYSGNLGLCIHQNDSPSSFSGNQYENGEDLFSIAPNSML